MLVANLLSLYIGAVKLSHQERDAYWDVLSMLEQRTSAPLHRLLGHPDICYVEYNSWQRQFILVTTPANRPGRSRKRHPLADIRIDRACS